MKMKTPRERTETHSGSCLPMDSYPWLTISPTLLTRKRRKHNPQSNVELRVRPSHSHSLEARWEEHYSVSQRPCFHMNEILCKDVSSLLLVFADGAPGLTDRIFHSMTAGHKSGVMTEGSCILGTPLRQSLDFLSLTWILDLVPVPKLYFSFLTFRKQDHELRHNLPTL